MLIFFITLSKPGDKRMKTRDNNGMYNSLQKDVGFSKAQLDQYQLLRKDQMNNIKPLFNEVREAKKKLYDLIYLNNIPDSLIMANADSIAQKQKTLDLQMFGYFRNTRNICTPDQLQKFDTSLKKVVQRMVGRPGKDNDDHKK